MPRPCIIRPRVPAVSAVTTLLFAGLAPGHALADDATPAGIEDVIVTATKRPEKLRDVPVSITVASQADLEARGATQLDDVVEFTPGLSDAGQGASQNNLQIRGVTTGAQRGLTQPTVSVLIDDLPTDPGAAQIGTTDLRLFDVQSVEVLRGPQGTLFGSGALSGALRIVTNKPDLTTFGAEIEASASGTVHGGGNVDGNVAVNLPLLPGVAALRLTGYAHHDDGWVDNLATGRKGVSDFRDVGGRAQLLVQPTEQLSVRATILHQDSYAGASGGTSYDRRGFGGNDYIEDNLDEDPISVENTIANVAATYTLGDVALTSSTSYSVRRQRNQTDGAGFAQFLGDSFGIPGLRVPTTIASPSSSKTVTEEFRLASVGVSDLKWTVGGYYQSLRGNGANIINSPGLEPILGLSGLGDLQAATRQIESAVFGEATYAIVPDFDITAGGRYARQVVAFTTASTGVLYTGALDDSVVGTSGRLVQESFDPRFAATWRATDAVNLYAQISRGFRVGGPNLTAGLAGPAIPTTYRSDHLWNYEIGTKTRLFGGRATLEADAYYIDWSDIQVPLLNAIAYTGNAGTARVVGVEVQADAQLYDWLAGGVSFSGSHGELTQSVPGLQRVTGAVGVASGERLPANPEYKTAAYLRATSNIQGLPVFARVDFQYVGPEYTDFGAKGTRFGDYSRLNLRAGLTWRSVEVTVFADNLLDSAGITSIGELTTLGGDVTQPRTAYRLRPVTVGLTLRCLL